MRYFRRSGPTLVLSEPGRGDRLVRGPTEGEPGTIVAYDDSYPDEAGWAEQMAATPGYYEVDANGLPAIAPPPYPDEAGWAEQMAGIEHPEDGTLSPPVSNEEQPVSE